MLYLYVLFCDLFLCRYNKLALDEPSNQIEDALQLVEVKAAPLGSLSIKTVAMGTSHGSAVSGNALL